MLEFLASYGERGYAVLRAAVEASLNGSSKTIRLGDFSYREVVAVLRENGVDYNPSMLLRILERDYQVIETSYRSGNQHWWRFVDLAAVMDALEEYEKGVEPVPEEDEGEEGEGIEDPRIAVLQAQFAALGVDEVYEKLARLAAKNRFSRQDRLEFSRIAFTYLERIAMLYERMSEYSDVFQEELALLARTLKAASLVARKMSAAQKARARKAKALEPLASEPLSPHGPGGLEGLG